MHEVAIALITALVIPVAKTVLTRHYEKQPEAWEAVFANLAGTAIALGAAAWLFSILPPAGSWGALIVGVAGCWLVIFGLIGVMLTWEAYKDIREKEHAPQKQPPDSPAGS